ncbi:hypothetical protein JGH11_11430 [Dysgonomonas sp. Marseille-P4677]|uniref:hypothetical protein n=1 Tax=Dysgonomonas sp. Marseille-P4677 TaxID=2364790 RepID=UPI0019118874|nr:hypothetical protein [Dysgonomonas sp. Marseille-P4677]MBK5721483.1 hypothetical protein [Dysgonomonas sp. Marseille-P4677]
MPKLKQIIPMLLPLILMFYFIYPQALDVMGSSFILLSGVLGLGLYAYHKYPFKEVLMVISGLLLLLFVFYTSGWINNNSDPYTFGYIRSQIAWFFSAYLVIFTIYKIHKRPSFNTLLLYIAAAIGLQAIITFGMNMNESIHDFFFSIQMQAEYTEEIMEEGGRQRLMGYGIAFFGAGAVSGIGLILISYLLMRMKLDNKGFFALAALYVFTFYVGLFMARTTIIGAAIGFAVIGVLYIWDNKSEKKQARAFFISAIFLMAGGYTLAMFYFPSFSDWAFELFINFMETGKLQTRSSDGLDEMFLIPEDLHTLIFGRGRMVFYGTDVGYSRMLFWVGIPGTLAFFIYQMFIVKLSYTKDWAVNLVPITIFVYTLVLNIKGWIDLNLILYLFFFYFMFYKYYVYMPKQYSGVKTMGTIRRENRLKRETKS